MTPTPGHTVEYTLDVNDAAQINRRRHDARTSGITQQASGAQVHWGNDVQPGETYPLVITRVWMPGVDGSGVNGQVLLDGNDTLWVTSVSEGDGERHWRPYPRV